MIAPQTYSKAHERHASPKRPMPEVYRTSQLLRMWQGLAALEREPQPSLDDWRVCSDVVNLLESLVDMGELQDTSGLLQDAISELAQAGKRHLSTDAPLRLSAAGIQAVRAVLEDYAQALEHLPHRTMIRAHRRTEIRIRAILSGRSQPHDVEVVDL